MGGKQVLKSWGTLLLLLFSASIHRINSESSSGKSSSTSRRPGQIFGRQRPGTHVEPWTLSSDHLPYPSAPRRVRKFSLPKWFRLPDAAALASLRDSRFVATFLSAFQAGILVFLAIEIVKAFRDVYREIMDEAFDFGGSPARTNNMLYAPDAVMSPSAAQNLVAWLGDPKNQRGLLPRSVPSWIVQLAVDLKSFCYGISDRDLALILARLTKPQAQMLQTCMLRPSGRVTFDSLEGMEYAKSEIVRWLECNGMSLNSSKQSILTSSPYGRLLNQGRQGMVLWGAPGCGKSMMIKAIADETRLPTLVITPSLLQRKWFGESTNQVRTLFGLISALGPCVVVLDELDGLFRSRSNSNENDANRELKTEFLQWWDGVMSDQQSNNRVLIVGATNRPWDVDPAVWRRLPLRFYIGAPNREERRSIWDRWMVDYRIPTSDQKGLGKYLSEHTDGYTCSDLFQVLQTACQNGPMAREHNVASDVELRIDDIQQALQSVSPTLFSQQYLAQLRGFLSPHDLQRLQMAGVANNDTPRDNGDDGTHVWRTPVGNFYQFNIPVHPQVFDVLHEMWLSNQEWESSSEDDLFSDFDEDSDTDNEL